MREKIYIIDAKRIPACKSSGDKIPPEEGGDGIKKYPGKYASVGSIELLSAVFKGILSSSKINVDEISDVVTGCAIQDSDQGINVSRIALLASGMPEHIPAATVNRLCGSSLSALMKASEHLVSGAFFKDRKPGLVLVGGVEHMGHHNMAEAFEPDSFFYEQFAKKNIASLQMGLTAELLAERYGITRLEQERFAYWSHAKAVSAAKSGRFDAEIIPFRLPSGEVLSQDVGPREYSSEEEALKRFGELKPAFKAGGTVTAATSAPYTDGAASVLVATESYVKANNLKPLAEIVSWASGGVDPNIMGIAPVYATQAALQRAGLGMKDMGLVELNEAFCAQSIAVIKQWSKDYSLDREELESRINVNGGATAMGHPLGASGAKLTATIVHEMQRRKSVEFALVTMCIGLGQGDALILKNV